MTTIAGPPVVAEHTPELTFRTAASIERVLEVNPHFHAIPGDLGDLTQLSPTISSALLDSSDSHLSFHISHNFSYFPLFFHSSHYCFMFFSMIFHDFPDFQHIFHIFSWHLGVLCCPGFNVSAHLPAGESATARCGDWSGCGYGRDGEMWLGFTTWDPKRCPKKTNPGWYTDVYSRWCDLSWIFSFPTFISSVYFLGGVLDTIFGMVAPVYWRCEEGTRSSG